MPTPELVLRLLIPTVLAVSAVYAALSSLRAHVRRQEGKPVPGVYPGSAAHRESLARAGVDSLGEWHRLRVEDQEAADDAALDLAEQAELDAKADAGEAAAHLVQRVQANALFHP